MHSMNPTYAPPRQSFWASPVEIVSLQAALSAILVWICVPLRESHPLIVGLLIGLFMWVSFVLLRALYRCPQDEFDRRFGR